MGCGCGRRKKRKPLTVKQKAAMRNRSNKLTFEKRAKAIHARNKIIKARLSLCEKCSHSAQTGRDKKYKIRICHKQNRPLDVISKAFSVGCPIGRFKAST